MESNFPLRLGILTPHFPNFQSAKEQRSISMVILELKETDSTVTSEETDAALTTEKKFLPEELIIDILSRLEIKRLCPLRCVSKTWLNLLTNEPYLANLHFNRLLQSNPNPSFLGLSNESSKLILASDFASFDKSIDLEVPFHVGKSGSYAIHGVQNGLVCLSCQGDDNIYIWNPFTKDYVKITCPSFISSLIPKHKSTRIYGFGYHEDTKDYKAITVWRESDFRSYAGVYTLGTDSWRLIDKDVPNIDTWTKNSPLVNGVFHWLIFKTGRLVTCIIVAFDMKDESFKQILPPDEVKFDDHITELGGLLCIFCADDENDVQIWAMQEYGVVDSWAKLYKIGNLEVCYSLYRNRRPLGIVVRSGEVIVMKNFTELISYDPKNNSVRETKDLGFEFNEVYTFIGSIISPRFLCNQAYHEVEEARKRKR